MFKTQETKGCGSMKKRKWLVIFLLCAVVICTVLISAFFLFNKVWVCNSIDSRYLNVAEQDGNTYMQLKHSEAYAVDMENKAFEMLTPMGTYDSLFGQDDQNVFEYEYFAGNYRGNTPEGYESVIGQIERNKPEKGGCVVYAGGYAKDGVLVGYVQVYNDTRGISGSYAVEEIDHSYAFTYNAERNEFTVDCKLDDVVIVALHEDAVVYWKDRAFYKYNMKSGEESLLVEDKGYDAGLTQYSSSGVISNSEFCIIHMTCSGSYTEQEYVYVYDWSEDNFFELKQAEK
jgi:hypothetical protein